MFNEIADGEVHVLSEELAYILVTDLSVLYRWNPKDLRKMMMEKYLAYLEKNRKFYGSFEFIERKNLDSMLGPKNTLALKFQRFSDDGLKGDD